ncbi:MAG: PAS domain-containing protein [candidate division WS1 bacterium]|jgi:signal transduction histidine kinase|nr:PAS domain-containing protein [candidate division WS1 bacterium]
MSRSEPGAAAARSNVTSKAGNRTLVLESIFNNSPLCLALLDQDLTFLQVNQPFARLCGGVPEDYPGESFKARCLSDALLDLCREALDTDNTQQVKGSPPVFCDSHDRPTSFWDISFIPIDDDDGGTRRLLLSLQDVTELTRLEAERRAIIEFLQIMNLTHDLHELAAALISHVRQWTGCEAAALRLRHGEDFPFFASEGFPQKLLIIEDSLCAFNEDGELLRDEAGRPILECVCGCVLCHKFRGDKPYLTEQGSFCVESATDFLEAHDGNLPDHLRGKCVEEGYQSIAIIPLLLQEEPFGLLHLCDHRRGIFDTSTVTVLERLAGNLAVALAHSRAEHELHRHQGRLRALASRLAMTEEQERLRIATVLHDDLSQSLAIAKLKLGSLRQTELSEKARNMTGEIEELVSEAIDFTRDLTVELSPPVLQQSGLAAALEWLADRVESRYGLSVSCSCHEDCFVDAEVDTTVFRSVRELLTNVVKYARAKTVRIWMKCGDDVARIGVSDDGIGFDAEMAGSATDGGGFGLFSIREALAHLGGHLEIQSAPGAGTTCVLVVPRTEAAAGSADVKTAT